MKSRNKSKKYQYGSIHSSDSKTNKPKVEWRKGIKNKNDYARELVYTLNQLIILY